jgi:predicted DNA-binding transcriptional regulator AlpA
MAIVLSKKQLSQKIGLCPAMIDKKVRDGSFPPPIQLSANRVGWLDTVIDAHLAALAREPRVPKKTPPNRAGYRGGRPRKTTAPVAPEAA